MNFYTLFSFILLTIIAAAKCNESFASGDGPKICKNIVIKGKKQEVCVDHFRSVYEASSIKINDEDLLKLINEVELKRQEVIGSYYNDELSQLEREKLATDYVVSLGRTRQLEKMDRIQDQRDSLFGQLFEVAGNVSDDEPFYSWSQKLQDLDDQYKAEEKIYLKMVADFQKKVDADVVKARQAVATGGINDDWQLFQLATQSFSERYLEITKGKSYELLTLEEKQAVDSIEATVVDLEMMAISVAAVKHLRCTPKANPGGDAPVLPESYDLFRAAAAMFIAAQINQTSERKQAINDIKESAITTEKTLADKSNNINSQLELNKQLINMKVAAMLMQNQVKSIDLRHASKKQASQIFKNAYEAALLEYNTKVKKLIEIDSKIAGALGRKNYNEDKESEFDLLSIIAFAGAAAAAASQNYGVAAALAGIGVLRELTRDDHGGRKDNASDRLAEYEKERKEYELHGHLVCHAIGSIDVPKNKIGFYHLKQTKQGFDRIVATAQYPLKLKKKRLFFWLKIRGHLPLTETFSQNTLTKSLRKLKKKWAAHSLKIAQETFNLMINSSHAADNDNIQTQEQGLALKGLTENFRFFMETKKNELYNINALGTNIPCAENTNDNDSIKPRGQVQAFPYPCHRAEYLNKLKVIAQANVTTLAENEINTAIDRRNTALALVNTTRQRLSIKPTTAQGAPTPEKTKDKNEEQEATTFQTFEQKGIITIGSGINDLKKNNKLVASSIIKNQNELNNRSKKAAKSKVNFSKRATQQRINSRRSVLKKILKKNAAANENKFLKDLFTSGGSFNQEDVAIANALNGGSAGGSTTGGFGKLAGLTEEEKNAQKGSAFDSDAFLEKFNKTNNLNKKKGAFDFSSSSGSDKAARDNASAQDDDLDADALGLADKKKMLANIKKNKNLKVNPSDGLFRKITKSYFVRAYPIFFELDD